MKLGLKRGVLEDLGPRDAGFVRRPALAFVCPMACFKVGDTNATMR